MAKANAVLELAADSQWGEVTALLKSGKATEKQCNRVGRDGLTPLHFAALDERANVVDLLLTNGADPLAGDQEGTTPLHVSAKLANIKITRLLVDHDRMGADVNFADKHGSTPLHFAVGAHESTGADATKVVKFLLDRGANPDAKDSEGKTPEDFAKSDDVRELLASFADDETSGRRRRRARGNESGRDDDETTPVKRKGARDDDGPASARRRRARPEGPFDALASEVVSAVDDRTDERRRRRTGTGAAGGRGVKGDSALEIMLAQNEEREEARLLDELSAGAPRATQWDLAIELTPELFRRDDDEERGEKPLTPADVVARVRANSVGLQSKLLAHPKSKKHTYLVLGADLGRLAKEAERVGMQAQLKPELEKRLLIDKARERGVHLEDLTTKYDDDVELSELELGAGEAYAPYRRAVHGFFQLAAAPSFFSCQQRTQLLRSILQAPREVGGAGLSLAQLRRDGAVAQVFALHDNAQRSALEDRWGLPSALALAPCPVGQLFNYFGAEYTLYFVFLRTFSMWLWAPALTGLVLFVFQETEYGGKESVWAAFYCMLLVVWASLFLCHWKRLQATLQLQWEGAATSTEDAKRREFAEVERDRFRAKEHAAGFYEPVLDDYQFVELERDAVPDGVPVPTAGKFPHYQRTLYQGLSWTVLALCATVSVVAQLGLLLLRTRLQEEMEPSIAGGVVAAFLNAVLVEVLQALFKPLVKMLVALQNYRSKAAHEYHTAVQLFALMFVNRFFSLFYLAMLKGVSDLRLFGPSNSRYYEVCTDRDGHPSDDCMEELFAQIVAMLVFAFAVSHTARLGSLFFTERRTRAQRQRRVDTEARMKPCHAVSTDFHELAMAFAMVTLFAGACPLAAGAALVSNAVEGRSDAYKYLRATQRPQTRAHADLGPWYAIFQFVCYMAILTNTVLMCYTSTALPDLVSMNVEAANFDGHRFVMLLVMEHVLLFGKILIDVLVPKMASGDVQEMALQRKLIDLADAHATKGTVRLGLNAAALVGVASAKGATFDDDDRGAVTGEVRAEEADFDDYEPKTQHPRMSDLGLLRSFRPGLEAASADDELQRRLQEAHGKAKDGKTKEEKAKAKGKERRKLSKQLAWTPYRALEREGANGGGGEASRDDGFRAQMRALERFSCTDVVWLFPVLLVWLVMLAIAVYSLRLGQPERLLYGVDYELNVCGVDNGGQLHQRHLRFASERAQTFPYQLLPATASVESGVDSTVAASIENATWLTGSRDLGPSDEEWWRPGRGSRSLLFYADPATRLPLCVSSCPSVASAADGLLSANRVCLYGFESLSYVEQEAALGTACFAGYDTVEVAGYCVPAAPLAQSEYDAAGVAIQASDLTDLRSYVESNSAARHFDASVGDLIVTWGVMLGALLGAVVLGALCTCGVGVAGVPLLMYSVGVLLTTASLCGLTYTFWERGESRVDQHEADSSDFGGAYESAKATAAGGYALCALTVVFLPVAAALGTVVQPSLPLLTAACKLIAMAPMQAFAGPLLAILGQGLLCAYWFVGFSFISSSGLLEFNEHAYAHLTYGSTLKDAAAFHVLGGLWTGAVIHHLGQLLSAFALGHAYWRAAESKLNRSGPHIRQWLLSPFLHLGSVALGATARASVLTPLLALVDLLLQCARGARVFDAYHEAGYVAVSLFGASLGEANTWGRGLAARFVPHVLRMQAHCAILTQLCRLAVACTCACVAAAVMAADPDYKDAVSSIGLPVAAIFVLSYVLASSLLGVVDLAVAAGVQSWCLDYKQNCVDQDFPGGDAWMMGVRLAADEAPLLVDLDLLLSEYAEEARQQAIAEGRATASEERARPTKGGLTPKKGGLTPKKSAASPKKAVAKSKSRRTIDDDDYDDEFDEKRRRAGSPAKPKKKAAEAPAKKDPKPPPAKTAEQKKKKEKEKEQKAREKEKKAVAEEKKAIAEEKKEEKKEKAKEKAKAKAAKSPKKGKKGKDDDDDYDEDDEVEEEQYATPKKRGRRFEQSDEDGGDGEEGKKGRPKPLSVDDERGYPVEEVSAPAAATPKRGRTRDGPKE